MQARFGKVDMLVPSPREVEACIRAVPEGQIITVSRIRDFLARKYSVGVTCPLTTGIFVRIAAEAAEEDFSAGRTEITPYWRVVKDDGSLYDKFPGGVERQQERLKAEGHRIVPGKGRRPPRVAMDERQETADRRSLPKLNEHAGKRADPS
jgi:alkylated DNA nucleotide flippase Atl1